MDVLLAPLAGSPKSQANDVIVEQFDPYEPVMVVLAKQIFCPAQPGLGKISKEATGAIRTCILPAV